MPTHSGPNPSADNSIVFSYDTGDVANSYRGEPTTNLINPNVINIYSWWTRNVASIVQLTETYKGQPIYRVSISIDNGDMLYHITERWGAGSGWYMPYVTFNANTPYIASVIYRPVSHPDTRIYGHPSNIGGWGATVDGNIDIDTRWKMHRIDRNFGATVGDNRFYHMHTPSAQIGQTIVVDITNSQIEQKPHVTPFVNGTRSATQGLLPLISNTSLNISTVSFDSNAQIVFDGTDDYIQSSFSNFNTTNGSIECVIYPETGGGSDQMVLNVGGTTTYGASRTLRILNGYWSFVTYGSTNQDWNSIVQVSYNVWNHVVMNWEGTTLSIYVNNIPYSIVKTGVITPAGTLLRAGAAVWNLERYYRGKISIFKIYNQALSASEVKQNYNQYKSRFNLS